MEQDMPHWVDGLHGVKKWLIDLAPTCWTMRWGDLSRISFLCLINSIDKMQFNFMEGSSVLYCVGPAIRLCQTKALNSIDAMTIAQQMREKERRIVSKRKTSMSDLNYPTDSTLHINTLYHLFQYVIILRCCY